MKKCGHCKLELPVESFDKNRSQPDGRQRLCKSCMAATKSRSRQKNRQKNLNIDPYAQPQMRKRCSTCSEMKPVAQFYKDGTRRDGLENRCKTCRLAVRRRIRQENPEMVRAMDLRSNLKKTYNLTTADKAKMFVAQNGMCLVCGKDLPYDIARIEHCHRTGVIRGLVHPKCNNFVTLFEEYPEIAARIPAYLKAFDHVPPEVTLKKAPPLINRGFAPKNRG